MDPLPNHDSGQDDYNFPTIADGPSHHGGSVRPDSIGADESVAEPHAPIALENDDADLSYDEFLESVRAEFVNGWLRILYPHQLLASAQFTSPFRDVNRPPCAFLGETTGRRKSLFELATLTIMGGVGVVVLPLITLAAQQAVTATHRRNQNHGSIHVFHLDMKKKQAQVQHIIRKVEDCCRNRNISVILFGSPEVLTDENLPWKKSLPLWRKMKVLQALFFDEIHLTLEWLYLRPAIANLFHDVFPKLFPADHPERHIPFCGMTATFSLEQMRAFELVSGVRFHNEDILWASPQQMARRSITLHLHIGHNTLPVLGNKIIDKLKSNSRSKLVCYFNDRYSAIEFKKALCKQLDEEGLGNETPLLIHGEMPRDVKAKLVKYFTGDETLPSRRKFRIMIATISVAGVGIDDESIDWMSMEGIFNSIGTMTQAGGRMARRIMEAGERDHLHTIASVESYAYLYERIYNTERDNIQKMQLPRSEREMDQPKLSPQEFRELGILELNQLLELITLNFGCMQGRIERSIGKPLSLGGTRFLGPQLGPCGGDCLFCCPNAKRRDVYRPVHRTALVRLLVRGFSVKGRMRLCPDMIDFIWNTHGVAKSVYGLSSSSLYKKHVNGTVLQLLGSNMLKRKHIWSTDEKSFILYVELTHTDDVSHVTVNQNIHPAGRFYCEVADAWKGIETKVENTGQVSGS